MSNPNGLSEGRMAGVGVGAAPCGVGSGGGRNVIFSMVSTRGLGRVVPAVTSEKAAGGGLIYRYVGT